MPASLKSNAPEMARRATPRREMGERLQGLRKGRGELEGYALAIAVYFAAMAVASGAMGHDRRRLAGLLVALGLWLGLCLWGGSGAIRHWGSLAMILPAYWSVEDFARSHAISVQNDWLQWDRWLLDGIGLRAAIESFGSIGPGILEWAYLLLYGFPPLALGLLYLSGAKGRAKRFLDVLFLGTLGVYALLPLLPVQSPRLAFPGQDLPGLESLPRIWNVWLLDRLDISTGVFPSGHVGVAFSCAFGLLSAIPERKLVWGLGFGFASTVFLATIYGRYHYALDGVASMAIAGIAWQTAKRMPRDVR